jgi:hypothetical protein
MARSYNGYYAGLSNRSQEFDSPTSRQVMSPSSTYGIRIPGFHPGESGSIPDGDAIFRMLTATFNFFGIKEKTHPVIFTRLRIMDNALGYEPGDRSSILLGGSNTI